MSANFGTEVVIGIRLNGGHFDLDRLKALKKTNPERLARLQQVFLQRNKTDEHDGTGTSSDVYDSPRRGTWVPLQYLTECLEAVGIPADDQRQIEQQINANPTYGPLPKQESYDKLKATPKSNKRSRPSSLERRATSTPFKSNTASPVTQTPSAAEVLHEIRELQGLCRQIKDQTARQQEMLVGDSDDRQETVTALLSRNQQLETELHDTMLQLLEHRGGLVNVLSRIADSEGELGRQNAQRNDLVARVRALENEADEDWRAREVLSSRIQELEVRLRVAKAREEERKKASEEQEAREKELLLCIDSLQEEARQAQDREKQLQDEMRAEKTELLMLREAVRKQEAESIEARQFLEQSLGSQAERLRKSCQRLKFAAAESG